jgi:hypothetical protein
VVGPPTAADRAVGVLLAPPTSSLGADSGGPGGPAGFVLDLLQDVFWPNADTGRVRAAAGAWTTAARGVGLLEAHCSSALATLESERSPEIPIATAVIRDVRGRVVDLAAQLEALGAACYEYADHVDAKRAELLSLLEDLVAELAIGAVVAGGLSFLSGGAATGFAGGTALGVRPVAVTAGEVAATTERINGARVLLTEAGGQGAARGSRLFEHLRPSWLDAHEGVGHTITKHVAKTLKDLQERLIREPRRTEVSTFRSQDEAELAIESTLRANESKIQRWLDDAEGSEAFRTDLGDQIGNVLVRGASNVVPATKVKVVLIPDAEMPAGWRLLTAHPEL